MKTAAEKAANAAAHSRIPAVILLTFGLQNTVAGKSTYPAIAEDRFIQLPGPSGLVQQSAKELIQ